MRTAEFLKIHRIEIVPGSSEVRLVADLRFGDVGCQGLVLVPFSDRRDAARVLARIAEAVTPEMEGRLHYNKTQIMPDGETLVVESGRIFPPGKREDYQ